MTDKEFAKQVVTKHRHGATTRAEAEVLAFYSISGLRVSRYMFEIGARGGRTTHFLNMVATERGLPHRIVAIEPSNKTPPFLRNNVLNNRNVEFIRGFSFDVAARIRYPFGFGFVDGCHCFNCVTKDIDLWAQKIVIGGYLAFHDAGGDGAITEEFLCQGRPTIVGVTRAIESSPFMKKLDLVDATARNGNTKVFQRRE